MNHAMFHVRGRALRLPLCLGIALVLSGCVPPPTKIQGDSGRVMQRNVQLAVNLTRERPHPASQPHSGYAIEARYQRMKTASDQTVTAGQQPVILNGVYFNPPVQLRNTFDFSYAEVGVRRRIFFSESRFGLEWNAGIAHTNLDLAVASPAQRVQTSFSNGLVHLGFGGMARINAASSVHLHGFADLSPNNGVNSVQQWEIYYAWAPQDNLSLQLGYADWSVDGSGNGYDSHFNLHVAGPMIRLQISANGDNNSPRRPDGGNTPAQPGRTAPPGREAAP